MEKKNIDFESLGIEFLSTPEQQANAGIFQLPPNFPSKEFVGEWVPEDQVQFKQQRQLMPQVGAMVPGLTVWKGEDGKAKNTVVHGGGNKKFVLMLRPRKLQEAMNALYGNVSKEAYNREVSGKTVAGAGQDAGMLSEQNLRQAGQGKVDVEESMLELNRATREPEDANVLVT